MNKSFSKLSEEKQNIVLYGSPDLIDFKITTKSGNTMKNNIEEVMNEYGDSLSEKEKISVLVNIIKKYLWGGIYDIFR